MYVNSLILPSGRQLPDDTAAIKHVVVRSRVTDAGQLLPGGVCAASVKAEILDPDGTLALTAGDRVQLFRVDEEGNTRRAGVFFLEKPERIGAEILELTGYDAVRKLDKDLTVWLTQLNQWPYTLLEFAKMVATQCGLTLHCDQMPNGQLPVEQFAAIATGRQLMRWICQACCRFCRATAEGELELAWFSDSGVMLAPTGENFYYRGALRFADYATEAVDGVQLRLADGKSSYLWPENGAENPWIITANPILAKISDQVSQALEVIAGEMAGMTYTPFRVTIPAKEDLVPGQLVAVETPGGAVIRACILEKERSGGRDTLSGPGSMRLSNKVSEADRSALDALNAALSAMDKLTQEEVFNKLTDNGTIEGLFMQNGQLYINASYLAAGVIRSADGTVEIDLASNTVTIHTDNGKIVLAAGGLYGYGADGVRSLILKPGSGSGSPTVLNSFQSEAGLTVAAGKTGSTLTLGQAAAKTEIRGSSVRLLEKDVEWRSNGDGTYSLIGK